MWALAIGPILMFIVNFLAQVLLAGEGPGACAGAVILPVYGLAASRLMLGLAGRYKP